MRGALHCALDNSPGGGGSERCTLPVTRCTKKAMDEKEQPGQKTRSDKLLRLISRIKKFDGSNDEGWDVWIQRFELLAGLGDKSEWLEALFICLDGKALDVCTSMPGKLRGQYAEVKKALKARFGKDVSTIHAYSDLNQAIRQTGESLEDFGDRIQGLANSAYPEKSFSDLQSVMVESCAWRGVATPGVGRQTV